MSSVLGTYARKNIAFKKGKGSYLFAENGEKWHEPLIRIGNERKYFRLFSSMKKFGGYVKVVGCEIISLLMIDRITRNLKWRNLILMIIIISLILVSISVLQYKDNSEYQHEVYNIAIETNNVFDTINSHYPVRNHNHNY